MSRFRNNLSYSLSISAEMSPNSYFESNRKQQQILKRNRNHRQLTQPSPFNDKVLRKVNPCILKREYNDYSKKITVLTPSINKQIYGTMEQAYLKAQNKQNYQQNHRYHFTSVQKQVEKINKMKLGYMKSANGINIHLKTKQSKPLKPIISETRLYKNQHQFLNVQKVILEEGLRNKKSQSVMINKGAQKFDKKKGIFPNSQLIKQINIIKEKLNIQKILENHEQTLQNNKTRFHNFINIKAYQSKNKSETECNTQQPIRVKFSNILELIKLNQSIKKQRQEKILQKPLNPEVDQSKKINSQLIKRKKKLNPPFQTYYYRDFLWKVNYSNSLYIEVPLQYQHRLKVFIGKGNNSSMVRGLISRRYWLAFTNKIEQANFLWTQVKILPYFSMQQSQAQQAFLINSTYQSGSIMTAIDYKFYQNYMNAFFTTEQHSDERLLTRSKAFKYKKYVESADIKLQQMQNHFINNYIIGNKKALFNTMSNYYLKTGEDVFSFLPLTFHIKEGLQDSKYFEFLRYYHKRAKQINRNSKDKASEREYNAWIVKPGQNSNRGYGIKVCLSLQQIKSILKVRESYNDGTYRTYIIQAYIEKPLLYFKRKFDLRHYIMITCVNGIVKGYWYRDGYVRTTSAEYSLSFNDSSIHLTNDAVQKQLPDYGKYEKGNKISYDQLNKYIDKYHRKNGIGFNQHIYPKMKKIATDTIRACSGGIDPSKLQNNFEVFGLDFMIDAELNVWLIEVNSNPCLELSCPLLASLIPRMVENTLQFTLDAMFPPPMRYCPKNLHYYKQLERQNRYELVFDERVEKLHNASLQLLDNKLRQEEEDTFEDSGGQWEDS